MLESSFWADSSDTDSTDEGIGELDDENTNSEDDGDEDDGDRVGGDGDGEDAADGQMTRRP